jgi:sterol 3beta-glucosyltransferase
LTGLLINCAENFIILGLNSLQLKMFSRMATLKDDGTVVVDIPTTIEAASLNLHSEDHQNVAFGGEPLDSSDLQDRPPMQIAMLIVGTRGDVQPFIDIGKHLQVSMLSNSFDMI